MAGCSCWRGCCCWLQAAGTYTISEILSTPGLMETSVFPYALGLVMLGAFTKSAQFPFHFWLPGAMAAPTPASAYLHSATMVKAGVYLLARLHPAFSESEIWFWSLLVVGTITMTIGAIFALGKSDLKALLAYATVSQLGILVLLLAFDFKEAAIAAVVGTLAHSLYKGPLFMVAGIIDHATHTRNIHRLANLWQSMPVVSGVAILAALSMAGLPPFFGFLAKETLLETLFHELESHGGVVPCC
ncbi:MAG: proton-conducting transporter membrane subunit [Caldilineaceae bacterium]